MSSRWLMAAVPVAFALAWQDAPPLAVFAAALVSIVPLVGLIGDATERLAARLGPTLGGLFNSTLNNLPELIIGGVALANGLAPVVKALTPSPNLDPGLVRESSCPGWGWKGFVDEEATQYRADRGLASAG
jgi:hypothetical protein